MNVISAFERDEAQSDAERKERLAKLLLELVRAIEPDVAAVLPRQVEIDSQMEALRTVLMRRELDVIEHLEKTVDDPELFAEAVSEILPHAVELSGARSEQLAVALAPTMERSTQASIRQHPARSSISSIP